MPPRLAIFGLSDVGRIRQRNEDSFAVMPELGIAVVADGMGGHPGGDVASRIAADTAAEALASAVRDYRSRDGQGIGTSDAAGSDFEGHFRTVMEEVVLKAHGAIREKAAEEPRLDGMGTTLTAMVVDSDSGSWVIGHVGDSRAYRFVDGALDQITRDDTWVQEQIDVGAMQPESARLSPYAHLLTQCVGLEDPPTPHVLHGEAARGESYLLCTDGLVGMLADDHVARILSEGGSLQALIDEANEAGGQDNITAALVSLE